MAQLLALHLKTRREARGLSQEQAAELFSVDKDTISRWERGKNRPTGIALLEALRREYSISQKELDDWFSEWALQNLGSDQQYWVRDFGYLGATGIDEEKLLEKLIEIDVALIPRLTHQDEGSVAQWAPIFQASPFTWKLLTWGDQIVGYWQFVFLKDEYFELVKQGKLRDSEIDPSMLEYPSLVDMSRNYRMYIIMIGVHGSHQRPGPNMRLIQSFVKEIENFTTNGWFISEFVAVAFTPQGVTLCNDFGMTFIGRHTAARAGELAEIFHATGRQVALQGHFSKRPKIAGPYLKRFPSTLGEGKP
ncbi:helix-turn-helix domain-containing protein [Hydrogenophaga sp.]|jgi:transcriptional regulator with XRE-family HTH domain|uniref:helix-turn-helix domain-containing protein n=1 Tax=Hydrogenophaga sp. TaxID=1904254 RepID=UPI003F6F0CE5